MASELRMLAERYVEILTTGAIANAPDVFAEDVTWQFGAAPPVTGRDGWQAMVGQWLDAFPDLEAISTDIVCDEEAELFAVRMRWTATHKGEFMGLAATGKTVVNEGVSMFEVDDGRVVKEWIFEDTSNLISQLQS
jgi:steroid delta-isomerase-like uncharacterized protein